MTAWVNRFETMSEVNRNLARSDERLLLDEQVHIHRHLSSRAVSRHAVTQ